MHTTQSGIRSRPMHELLGYGAAAGLVIGSLLPWATAPGFSFNAMEADLPWILTGFDSDTGEPGSLAHGLIFLALAAAIGALAWRRSSIGVLAAGGAAAALAIVDTVAFLDVVDGSRGESLGLGAYVTILAGGVAVAAGFLGRSPRDTLGDAKTTTGPAPPAAATPPPSTTPSTPHATTASPAPPASPTSQAPSDTRPARRPESDPPNSDRWWE